MATEKRLIDADALEQSIITDYYEHFTRYHDTDQITLVDMVLECICETPTVDAVEVVHGRWKGAGFGDYYCSICLEKVSGNNYCYCPNCSARMDNENEDDN